MGPYYGDTDGMINFSVHIAVSGSFWVLLVVEKCGARISALGSSAHVAGESFTGQLFSFPSSRANRAMASLA